MTLFDPILTFWFNETSPRQWWKVDSRFDTTVRERFGVLHRSAHVGELWEWRRQPRGRLAEIILLDQFSRNLYRGTPQAFASDAMALALAQEAVAGRHDMALVPQSSSRYYSRTISR